MYIIYIFISLINMKMLVFMLEGPIFYNRENINLAPSLLGGGVGPPAAKKCNFFDYFNKETGRFEIKKTR